MRFSSSLMLSLWHWIYVKSIIKQRPNTVELSQISTSNNAISRNFGNVILGGICQPRLNANSGLCCPFLWFFCVFLLENWQSHSFEKIKVLHQNFNGMIWTVQMRNIFKAEREYNIEWNEWVKRSMTFQSFTFARREEKKNHSAQAKI